MTTRASKGRRRVRTPLERAAHPGAACPPDEADRRSAPPDLSHDRGLWQARERVRAWAAKSALHMWMIRMRVEPAVTEITVACVEAWLLAWADVCGTPVYPPEEQQADAGEQLDRRATVARNAVPELAIGNRPREVRCERCGRRRKSGEQRYCGACAPVMRRQLEEQGWDGARVEAWCMGDDQAADPGRA